MQLKTLALALLPALALADTTSTVTSTTTLTQTITLQRVVATAYATSNSTTVPTGAIPSTTGGPLKGAAGTLNAAQYALAGVAGMVVVALM